MIPSILFAILLAILLGISSIEYALLTNNKKPLLDENVLSYKTATGWAFWGILLTSLSAITQDFLPPESNEILVKGLRIASFAVPIMFICQWAVNYIGASVTMDLGNVETQYELQLSKAIVSYLKANTNELIALSTDQIYKNVTYVPRNHIIGKRTLRILKYVTFRFKPINEIVREMDAITYSKEKVQKILNEAISAHKDDGSVTISPDGKYYFKIKAAKLLG